MTTTFRGVWPAMLTPLRTDGSPNLGACEQLVDLFAKQGLGGIYLVGSTGQWPLFTMAERKAIAECVVKAAAGKIPVMVHVGAVTTADAVDLAKHAAKIGADAVSAVGPIYFSHSVDAVFDYYTQIGAASDRPLFAYHLSGVSQMSVGPREYAERFLKVPNAAGMKITALDLYSFGLIQGVAGDRLQLFSGADEVMCHALLSGAIGAIGSYYNLWGAECKKAREATAAGDIAMGREFMLRFQAAIADVLANGGMWTFFTTAMKRKHGIDVGRPRPPLAAADKTWSEAEVDRILARLA